MLAMIIEGRRYVIGLEGIYPPLAACVDMQSRGASGAPAPSAAPDRPPSSPRAQTPKGGEATPLRREAEQLVGKIFMRPGMHAVRLLPETVRAEMPAKYSDDAIWSAPGMLGQLKIVSTGSVADADKILSLIGAVDETGCKVGAFRSGQRDDMPGGSAIRSFFDCVEGGRHALTVHTILRRSESSYYVFSLFSDPEMRDSHKMIEQMDGVLRRAIFDVMGR